MKSVGVRELKAQANALLNANEALIIKRHGQPIGAYIPFQKADKAAAARSADKLAATLDAIYAETGMSEDQFVAAFLAAGDDVPAR
jgi:antitoxin (DNA-binding transcriptional repressor) of toxin-antitoxin stability system